MKIRTAMGLQREEENAFWLGELGKALREPAFAQRFSRQEEF